MNNPLLPSGSSSLEHRVTLVCAVAGELAVSLRDLWNPDRCPAAFLPYLAWAFSVDGWDEDWSEQDKRRVVREAFWLHQRKGTIAAVYRAVEYHGFTAEVAEWFDTGDPRGTFRLEVDVNETGLTGKVLTELERVVEDTKPVSRHISSFTISTRTDGPFYLGAALLPGDIVTVYPQAHSAAENLRYLGITHFDGNYHFSGDDDD